MTSTDHTPETPDQSGPAAEPAQPQQDQAVPTEPEEPDYKALYEQARAEARRWEGRAKENRDKARKLDQLEEANRSEAEKLQQHVQHLQAARDAAVRRAVEAEVRAAATGWANPADAPRFLDDASRYLTEDDQIDTEAIRADLDAVLAERPYLARAEDRRRPAPDAGQGARPDGSPNIQTQIAQAQASGDWHTSLSLKTQQALDLNRPA